MSFRSDRSGSARFLGQREADIMEILWDEAPLSGKEVHFRLRLKQKLALTTVLTLLARLVKKNIVTRSSRRRVNVYSPASPKAEFLEERIKEILKALKKDFPKQFKKALGGGKK